MTAKRRCKKHRASKISDSGNLFRSFASKIASAQVSPKPELKHLAQLLGYLLLTQPNNWENCDVSSLSWDIKLSGKQVESINFESVCNLSDVLFTELDRRFENLFSTLFVQNAETSPTFASIEESIELATLFLRCCVKIMPLLFLKQELVLEKAKTLLSILSKLMRAGTEDCSFVFTDDRPLDPRYTFLSTALEVFMDEILVNKSIRDLLVLVDSAFSSCRLFSKHHMANLVGMVSAHFNLSLSDEKMNKMYVERLYSNQVNAFRPPQISLSTAALLLQNLVMFSAPRMVHAYVVLLVSDAIGSCLNLRLIDRYIDTFEKSVLLYTRHMCKGENALSGKFGEHLLLPSTLKRVDYLTLKLKESWGLCQSNNAKRDNNELVACSVAYAKKSLSVFDSSCSENMLSILGCVILRASSDDVMDSVLQKCNASRIEDLCLLSSTLKLMNCSMLQAIQVFRNWNGDFRASCKEYKTMMDVVQRFEQFSVDLPGQNFLRDKMGDHVKSKWMLMHFSGLLSVGFALKLEFMMKDSVFGMLLSLYLFVLEGGDLEALSDSVCHTEDPSSSLPSSGKAEETPADRRLSGAVARKFQKIRTLYLGKVAEAEEWDSGGRVEEERSNVGSFLSCMSGKGNLSSADVDELSDFIVCEPGKDYADWLKGRERYRSQRWKSEKIKKQWWNKKKAAWRDNKGRFNKKQN